MVFQGFVQKFPEYEVPTPITNNVFTVRSITTAEELKLKSSLVSQSKLISILNSLLYDCIIQKPESITDIDTFKKNTTIIDRDALFLGWYHCSYGSVIEDIPVVCNKCKHEFTFNYDIEQGAKVDSFNGLPGELLNKRISVNLNIAPAIVELQLPTLEKEELIQKNTSSMKDEDDITNLLLIISDIYYFLPDDKDRTNPIKIENMLDKIYALKSLVPKDKKQINKAFQDEFGKYGVTLDYEVTCPNCSNTINRTLDLVRFFFRALYES